MATSLQASADGTSASSELRLPVVVLVLLR
jgi:hypothetical protein